MQEVKCPQLHLGICDDSPADRRLIEQAVENILSEQQLSATISCYESGAALLHALETGRVFHILLLDVLMDEMDGMALAARLRMQGSSAAIVFISSSLEMSLRGYEVAAVRYLVKPLDEGKLREALLFCFKSLAGSRKLLLSTSKGRRKIDLSSIICAESQNRGVLLTLASEQISVAMKLSELSELLPQNQFIFCHRTILVNLDYVNYVRRGELELKNGQQIPISKYRFAEVQSQLLSYLNA